MKRSRPLLGLVLAAGLSIAGTPGCAGRASSPSGAADGARVRGTDFAMDQTRLEMLFAEQVDAITGPAGAIHTVVDGVQLYCISDAANDRMRLIAPIAQASSLDSRLLEVLLRANFHTALDARYAISEDVVFAVFVHPISSLSPELLRSAMSQVVSLARTFGTTFSSGELVFPEAGGGAP